MSMSMSPSQAALRPARQAQRRHRARAIQRGSLAVPAGLPRQVTGNELRSPPRVGRKERWCPAPGRNCPRR
eukprot:650221-Alexandrium_andersonii.AAC.1